MEQFIKIIKGDSKKYEKLSEILKIIVIDAGIDQKKYLILGSFAIREYREINDLDINMDSDEFMKLSKLKYGELQFYNGQIRWFLDMTKLYQENADSQAKDFSIEMFQKKSFEGFPNNQFSLKYLSEHNGLVTDENGYQYFSPNTLLDWKKAMNRDKDKEDIKILKKILDIKESGYKTKYLKYKRKFLELRDGLNN